MKKILSLILIAGILATTLIVNTQNTVYASTSISGIIDKDTTWTKSNSPYNITGNTLVDTGVTLTIEHGVTIVMAKGIYLKISGKLAAIGTEFDNIKFTVQENLFGAAFIDLSSDNNLIEYCEIFMGICLYGSQNQINHCTINNTYGIKIGKPYTIIAKDNIIKNCVIQGTNNTSLSGIEMRYTTGNKISGCKISNFNSGVHLRDSKDNIIETCEIFNCGKTDYASYPSAIHIYYCTYNTSIYKCTIENNKVGIHLDPIRENHNTKIECNSFINNEIGINYDTTYASPPITDNNFISSLSYHIKMHGDSSDVDANNNYWGTPNKAEISEKIYDFYKDFNLGKVIFEPFLTKPVDITRLPMDYDINSVTLQTTVGGTLSSIPTSGDFRVNVNLIRNADKVGDVIIIALYNRNGRFLRMYQDNSYLTSNVTTGVTAKFSQLVSQVEGTAIAKIKVLIWSGMGIMKPLVNVGIF